MFKQGKLKVYLLELTDGSETWFSVKRYSEFLDCHKRLVEQLGPEALPAFPPKEPLLQRMFSSRTSRRRSFIGERQLQLQEYLMTALENPSVAQARVLQRFLQRPEPGSIHDFIDGSPL